MTIKIRIINNKISKVSKGELHELLKMFTRDRLVMESTVFYC